jgi:hypothetical protein
VKAEYASDPALLTARMKTLASMVFFSAPEVKTDESAGKMTPFHGMDEAAFEGLMRSEDFVFGHHMQVNGGSPNGVRPFSVCETTFMIKIAKGEIADPAFVSMGSVMNYDAYAKAFEQYSQGCSSRDLNEWYNFRGLGGLRPSWLESNVSDRFLRRMVKDCQSSNAGDCAEWNRNRIGYRDRKNTELALRTMVYDPRPETKVGAQQIPVGDYMVNPSNPGVFVEDRNGDGVGEWIPTGPLSLYPGAKLKVSTAETFSVSADTPVTLSSAITIGAQTLGVGSVVVVRAGTRLGFASGVTIDPVTREAVTLTSVRIPPGTSLGLPDGTTVTTPYSMGPSDPVSKHPKGKLQAAIKLEIAQGWVPSLEIRRPKSGVLAANKFAGELSVPITLVGGAQLLSVVDVKDVVAKDEVDPRWKKEYAARADLGLLTVFSDGSGCKADMPSRTACPLLNRFFSMIDRHENFYQTYSGLSPDSEVVSQQPSPLVACSITLRASHHWDSAGTPQGGTTGGKSLPSGPAKCSVSRLLFTRSFGKPHVRLARLVVRTCERLRERSERPEVIALLGG